MIEAEFVKRVDVAMPDEDIKSLDIFIDPSTGYVFALDAEYLDKASSPVEIQSPFSRKFKVRIS